MSIYAQSHPIHWTTVKQILQYIKETVNHGLFFNKSSSLALTYFSIADWDGSSNDQRSTSGQCVLLGSNLFSWSANKQNTLTKSSTESEYRSLAHCAVELSWILYILKDLHIPISQTPITWCDNVGAEQFSYLPTLYFIYRQNA